MAALAMAAYTWDTGCRDRVLCKYTTYTVHHLYDECLCGFYSTLRIKMHTS